MDKIPFSFYDFFGYLGSGFLLLVAIDYAAGGERITSENVPTILAIFWVVLIYVAGHIIAHVSSIILEVRFLRKVLKSPEEHLFATDITSKWAKIFPGHFKPLPESSQERLSILARKEGFSTASDRGFFFHCHAHVKRDEATLNRLNTFLKLYGFCRNLSMALLFSAVVLFFWAFESWKFWEAANGEKLGWAGLALFAAFMMLLRYLKFFRHYTLEVYNTFAALKTGDNDEV